MAEVSIEVVPVPLAKDVWKELHTQLDGAMRYHIAMDVDDLLYLLQLNRLAMLVAIVDNEILGCFVIRVEEYPRKRICEIVSVAGKRGATRSWIDPMLERLTDWALERGCNAIAGIGRKGWMVARDYGWKVEKRAILVKDLDDERRRRQSNTDTND